MGEEGERERMKMNALKPASPGVKAGSAVLRGLIVSLAVMAAATVAASLIYKFADVRESTMTTAVYIIHSLSLFVGGIATGRGAGRKGWYFGGWMGFIYCLVIVTVGFLSYDAALTMHTLILLLLSLASGALGGIIGVNLRN